MEEQQLSAVDASWFQMDEAGNAADINVLWEFDEALSHEALVILVEERLLQRYGRFRQRVVRHGLSLFWEDDPDFHVDRHIDVVQLDGRSLEDLLGELTTPDLPHDKPLWQMMIVEGLDRGNALIARIHHCMGDGFGLGAALLRMADSSPDGAPAVDEETVPHPDHQTLREVLVAEAHEVREHPEHAIDLAKGAAKATAALTKSLGHLLMMSFDPKTVLHDDLCGNRRVAWSRGIEVERVKAIGRGMGATINDTVLTAMTGAIRRWLEEHDRDVDFDIRAMVPINLRAARSMEEVTDDLGNRFGLVLLDLPTAADEPHERLSQLKASMDELKNTPEALVAFGILNAVGKTPAWVEHFVTHIFARKASLVITNVPGPREQLYLAGCPIRNIVFWVPHPALFGLGVSIISYNGELKVGVRSDTAIVRDPAEIAQLFDEELLALERAEVD